MKLKSSRSSAAKIGLALAAAGALAIGGIAPAYAANAQLGPDDIANYENGDETSQTYNYDQWHIGSTTNSELELSDSVSIGECSITMLAHEVPGSWVQVLKGFPIDGRPTAPGGGSVDAIRTLIESTIITVETGEVTVQIPFFERTIGGAGLNFTTVRSVPLAPGTHNLADLELQDSRGWLGGQNMTVSEFLEAMQRAVHTRTSYEALGVGFNGNQGAAVTSISFAGDTFSFGTGDCTPDPTPTPTPTPVPDAPKPPVAVHTGIQQKGL